MQLLKKIRHMFMEYGIEVRKSAGVEYSPLPVFQICVAKIMRDFGSSLRFIQVGANDGVYGDPIRGFITKYKWSGILVEPQLDVFECLKQNYATCESKLTFENVAVSGSSEFLTIYRAPQVEAVPGQPMGRALTVSSTNAAVVAKQTGLRKEQLTAIKVPCMTLNQLIEKHQFQALDLLQIDVEGHDLHVLKTIDLSKYRPKIIQFEHGHLSRQEIGQAADFLTKNNYHLYYGGQQSDSVAMPKELIESAAFWP